MISPLHSSNVQRVWSRFSTFDTTFSNKLILAASHRHAGLRPNQIRRNYRKYKHWRVHRWVLTGLLNFLLSPENMVSENWETHIFCIAMSRMTAATLGAFSYLIYPKVFYTLKLPSLGYKNLDECKWWVSWLFLEKSQNMMRVKISDSEFNVCFFSFFPYTPPL